MRLLRKFYYTTVLTGLLFIFSNLSFPGAGSKYSIKNVISEPTEIQSLQDERLSKLNEYTEVNEQEVNEHIETVKGKEGEDIEVSFNPNTGLYIIQNNSYVYIDGKYFPYNTKNRYEVNGVMTFYKPKPVQTALNVVKKVVPQEESLELSKINTEVSPGGVMNADNIRSVMSNLEKAQRNMKKRNEALKELLSE